MCVIKLLNLSKENRFKSPNHNQYEKSVQINHTIKDLHFFDLGQVFNDYITNHNKTT